MWASCPPSIPAGREEFDLDAGVIVLATGFRPYQPRPGEYGFKELPEVVTLPEFIRLVAEAEAGGDTLMLQRPAHPPPGHDPLRRQPPDSGHS